MSSVCHLSIFMTKKYTPCTRSRLSLLFLAAARLRAVVLVTAAYHSEPQTRHPAAALRPAVSGVRHSSSSSGNGGWTPYNIAGRQPFCSACPVRSSCVQVELQQVATAQACRQACRARCTIMQHACLANCSKCEANATCEMPGQIQALVVLSSAVVNSVWMLVQLMFLLDAWLPYHTISPQATARHFEGLRERYGSPCVALNLLKGRERRARETLLRREMAVAIHTLNRRVRDVMAFCNSVCCFQWASAEDGNGGGHASQAGSLGDISHAQSLSDALPRLSGHVHLLLNHCIACVVQSGQSGGAPPIVHIPWDFQKYARQAGAGTGADATSPNLKSRML